MRFTLSIIRHTFLLTVSNDWHGHIQSLNVSVEVFNNNDIQCAQDSSSLLSPFGTENNQQGVSRVNAEGG